MLKLRINISLVAFTAEVWKIITGSATVNIFENFSLFYVEARFVQED